MSTALNREHYPDNACFGCGPANPDGLQLRIVREGETLVADVTFADRYQGPTGIVNGGMVSVPMDCLSTWTAMDAFGRAEEAGRPVPAVTAEYRMRLRRPTPTGSRVHIVGRAETPEGSRVRVHTEARAEGEVTAEFYGVFARVPERP